MRACWHTAAGNGTAVRAGSVGQMVWDVVPCLIRATHDQGSITH